MPAHALDPVADRVSVIIATHRRPRLLRAALDSVQRQSTLPHEVIVADDGSTLPGDFANADRDAIVPVRYLLLPKSGMCAARRAGCDASSGDLLLFLDDDDELEPDAVRTLTAILLSHPDAVVAAGSAALIDGEGHLTGRSNPVPDEVTPKHLWFENQIVNAGAAVIRRAAYQQAGGWNPDAPNAADYLLWLKLVQVGRIVGTSDLVLRYRSHGTTESAKGNQFLNIVAFRRALRAAIPEVAHTEVEDSIIASLVRNHAIDTYWHWQGLVRRNQWSEAWRRLGPLMSATVAAALGRRTRQELAGTFRRLKPK